MSYFMESAREGERLRAQESANPSLERLLRSGLRDGMTAVDVGCGSGAVTKTMADIVGPRGHVVGVEPAPARLEEARSALRGVDGAELVAGALPATGLPDARFDFVWSQFVFEYLRDPAPALAELVRLARPGGVVAVADIDGFGMSFWPTNDALESAHDAFMGTLATSGFDLFVGRKLFALFRRSGLADVRVHVTNFHVTAGAADARLLDDWRVRFDNLEPLATGPFGGEAAYRRFAQAYLEMLADADTLKYAVVVTTVGTRP